MEFSLLKEANNSIATKMCANLLNNLRKNQNTFSSRQNLMTNLCRAPLKYIG